MQVTASTAMSADSSEHRPSGRARGHLGVLTGPALALVAAAGLRLAGIPFAVEITFGLLLAACIAMCWLRRDCLMWSTYAVGLVAHAVLWDRAGSLGATVRYEYVADLDRALGLGTLPTVWLQQALVSPAGLPISSWLAFGVYLTFFGLPLFLLTPLRRRDYEHGRLFISAVLLTSLASWPVFALVPTAPPWLAAEHGLAGASLVVPLKSMLQGSDPNEYIAAGTNLVAAMPSLHQAIAVVCALSIARSWPRLGWVAVSYAVAMAFSLVYLGEHYVVDVVAGTLLALASWRVALLASASALRRWGGEPPASLADPARDLASVPGRLHVR